MKMMRNQFNNKERIRIILLGLLYIGAIYCAIDISRFHQEFFYADSVKAHISNPAVSYPLFAFFSAAFLFLALRKGLDTNIRNAFILVYATTVSTVLILYKLANLIIYLMHIFAYLINDFELLKILFIYLFFPISLYIEIV